MLQISRRAAQIAPSATLAIDTRAKALKAEGRDVVGFGAGEPDFDTPEYVRAAAQRAIDEGPHPLYPPCRARSLCARSSRKSS